jgi:hypothetical protein
MALHKADNPFSAIVDGCDRFGLIDSAPTDFDGGQVSKALRVGQTRKITETLAPLCWLLRASVHKLAICISAIFLFSPFSLVKEVLL